MLKLPGLQITFAQSDAFADKLGIIAVPSSEITTHGPYIYDPVSQSIIEAGILCCPTDHGQGSSP